MNSGVNIKRLCVLNVCHKCSVRRDDPIDVNMG